MKCSCIQIYCDMTHSGLPALHWLNASAKFTIMQLFALHQLSTPVLPWHDSIRVDCFLSTKCPCAQGYHDATPSGSPALCRPNAPAPMFTWSDSFRFACSLSTEHTFLLHSNMLFHMSSNGATALFDTYTDIVSVLVDTFHWNANIIHQNVIFNISSKSGYFIIFFHTMHTHHPRSWWWCHILSDLLCVFHLLHTLHLLCILPLLHILHLLRTLHLVCFYCMDFNLSICRADEILHHGIIRHWMVKWPKGRTQFQGWVMINNIKLSLTEEWLCRVCHCHSSTSSFLAVCRKFHDQQVGLPWCHLQVSNTLLERAYLSKLSHQYFLNKLTDWIDYIIPIFGEWAYRHPQGFQHKYAAA